MIPNTHNSSRKIKVKLIVHSDGVLIRYRETKPETWVEPKRITYERNTNKHLKVVK